MKSAYYRGFFIVSLLSALIATGCQTAPSVQTEFDPKADFEPYEDYAILPLPDNVPGADPGMMLRLREPALSSIRQVMTEKGFREVDRDSADFAVNLRGEINPKVKVTNWGYNGFMVDDWGRVSPYRNVEVDQYNEGALILEIYDAESKELSWVGWVKGRSRTTNVVIEKFQESVRAILQTFPPGSETASAE